MGRFLIAFLAFVSFVVSTPAWAQSTSASANLSIAVTQSQAISSVSLSNNSFMGGASSGTVVGMIIVTMSPAAPPFAGTLSLGGANAPSFQIVGSNLETNGVVPAGTYAISIVATEAGATGSPFTQAEAIIGMSSTASTCPQGNAYPGDGCTGAQASGSTQITNWFGAYTGNHGYANHRPLWNVAGVDYPVGYDTTLTLKDPSVAGNLPSCATYSNNSVNVNSAPCTINGFNFGAQNCITLGISGSINDGAIVEITNNHFLFGSNCASANTWLSLGGSGPNGVNTVIMYNQFDGSTSAQFEEIIGKSTFGNVTSEYNAFFNTDKDTWHLSVPTSNTNVVKYNYIEGFMNNFEGHSQFTYLNDAGAQGSWDVEYNTGFLSLAGDGTAMLSFETGGFSGITVPTVIMNNNTMVEPNGGANRVLNAGYPSGSPNSIGNLIVQNNYVDPGPASGGWFYFEGGSLGSATCNGNKNLTNGATFTYGSPVSCD